MCADENPILHENLGFARAIVDALKESSPSAFVSGKPGEDPDGTIVDGTFNLLTVAAHLRCAGWQYVSVSGPTQTNPGYPEDERGSRGR